jgi:3-dehydroquinate dehydratase-2
MIAVGDAPLLADLPFIEVHISNIHAGEKLRHQSLASDIASGIAMGSGPVGYRLALMGTADLLAMQNTTYGEDIN